LAEAEDLGASNELVGWITDNVVFFIQLLRNYKQLEVNT